LTELLQSDHAARREARTFIERERTTP